MHKFGAILPGMIDDIRHPPIAGKPGFQQGRLGSFHVILIWHHATHHAAWQVFSYILRWAAVAQWKGVWGLGMEVLTPTCSLTPAQPTDPPSRLFGEFNNALNIFQRLLWMTDHKISLIVCQRAGKQNAVSIKSASVIGLLIIFRRRSVPASGARVNPPPGERACNSSINSSEKDSIRSEQAMFA